MTSVEDAPSSSCLSSGTCHHCRYEGANGRIVFRRDPGWCWWAVIDLGGKEDTFLPEFNQRAFIYLCVLYLFIYFSFSFFFCRVAFVLPGLIDGLPL